MKHTCLNHPKTLALQKWFMDRNPSVPYPELIVIGMLESLFNYLGAHCKSGAIGTVHPRELSRVLYWSMDGDIYDLINGMIEVGYFKLHRDHGFVMAGWTKHCPDYVHSDLAKKGERFWDGSIPSLKKLGIESGDRMRALEAFAQRERWTDQELAEVFADLKKSRPTHSLLFSPKINEPEQQADEIPMDWPEQPQQQQQQATPQPIAQPSAGYRPIIHAEVSQPVKKPLAAANSNQNAGSAADVNVNNSTADASCADQGILGAGNRNLGGLTNTNTITNTNRRDRVKSARGFSSLRELAERMFQDIDDGASAASPPGGGEPAAARQPGPPPAPPPTTEPLPTAETRPTPYPAAARQPGPPPAPPPTTEPLPTAETRPTPYPAAARQPSPTPTPLPGRTTQNHQTQFPPLRGSQNQRQWPSASEPETFLPTPKTARPPSNPPDPSHKKRDAEEPPLNLHIGTDEDWRWACRCADLIESDGHESPVYHAGGEARARAFVALADLIQCTFGHDPWPRLYEVVDSLTDPSMQWLGGIDSESQRRKSAQTISNIWEALRRFPDGVFPGQGDPENPDSQRRNFRMEQAARIMRVNKHIFKKSKH